MTTWILLLAWTALVAWQWIDWYRASPRWYFWAPLVGVMFLWTLLVLA